ncbi:MAG: hypothetical protein IJD47_03915 [Clostridia bacterium]|nr:hypothetical protein [Clostridia bacterium]
MLTYYTPTALVLQLFFESSFCPILLIVGIAFNKTKCKNSLPLLCVNSIFLHQKVDFEFVKVCFLFADFAIK